MRIWSGFTKFLRAQCNKDRVIDSLYFGNYFRKEAADPAKVDEEDKKGLAGNVYACIHDAIKKNNSYLEFKQITNGENFDALPPIVSTELNMIKF